MPLQYAEFAHHYDGHDATEAEKRAHFETLADFLECIARLFWHDDSNRLGISFDGDSLRIAGTLDSKSIQASNAFCSAANEEAARKKDS